MNPTVFFIVFFFIVLLVAGWITLCTEIDRIGIYRDSRGIKHKVPLSQNVPIDYELQSVKNHIQITRGLGKGNSMTI